LQQGRLEVLGRDLSRLAASELVRVRRPRIPCCGTPTGGTFNIGAALDWFQKHARGQGYDWIGLLRFATTNHVGSVEDAPRKQFCSEFAARYYAKGGFLPFGDEDADAIAPFQFDTSPLLPLVWRRP